MKQEGTTTSSSLLLAVATGAVGYALFTLLANKKRHEKDKFVKLPLREVVSNLSGPRGPMYFLEKTRAAGGAQIMQIPALIPGLMPELFILTNYRAARKFLEGPSSARFAPASQFFTDTTNGPNMVNSEGHRWKHVRKSTAQAFSAANIRKMVPVINDMVDKWSQETLNLHDKNDTAVIAPLREMNKITASIIGQVAFDYDFSPQERDQILACVETCWLEFGQKMGNNLFKKSPITRWMFSGIRRAQAASKQLYQVCEKMLHAYRQKETKAPSTVIHAIDNDPNYENDEERIRDLIAFVIAGFDTTSNALAFAFRELALDPTLQSKLRESIQQHAPDGQTENKYLKAFTREILRLYPPAMGGIRQVKQPFVDPNNPENVLPKNSLVFAVYYCIHRDPTVFSQPDRCIPERWLEASPSELEPMMSALMPFSAGARLCMGQALANAELYQVLEKLVSQYQFSIEQAGEPENIVLFKPIGTLLKVQRLE